MSSATWSGGGSGAWGPHSGSLRSGGSLLLREQWIRLALLSGDYPELLRHGATASVEVQRRRAQSAAEDADEFLNWIFVFGLMTVVYSLSRYFARRHRLGEFDARNVGDRIPRPPSRPAEPPSFLRRIDTWCPAKSYSSVLEEFQADSGVSSLEAPAIATDSSTRIIEMTERATPGGASGAPPVGAPPAEPEKEGLGRFIESGCAICFEEFVPSVVVRVLPCRHIFHRTCLDTWFHRSSMCPLCMHDYSRGPPATAGAAAPQGPGGGGGPGGDTQPSRERFISFRFFSFPGRLRQQR